MLFKWIYRWIKNFNYLESGEVKIFINTGRNLEGFYPLGNRISNGNVLDFSGNYFNGKICDAHIII